MFDLGFIKDIRFLLRKMPPPGERQNLLFSATLSASRAGTRLRAHERSRRSSVEPDKVTTARAQKVYFPPCDERRLPLLLGLLSRRWKRRAPWCSSTPRRQPSGAKLERATAGRARRPLRRRAAEEARVAARALPARASWRCWSPPTSPRAACTSRTSATCSTTTCRRTPRTTCTASAAPRARAPGRRDQLRLRALRDQPAGHRGLHRPRIPTGVVGSDLFEGVKIPPWQPRKYPPAGGRPPRRGGPGGGGSGGGRGKRPAGGQRGRSR
jgi:hypothetical protein